MSFLLAVPSSVENALQMLFKSLHKTGVGLELWGVSLGRHFEKGC